MFRILMHYFSVRGNCVRHSLPLLRSRSCRRTRYPIWTSSELSATESQPYTVVVTPGLADGGEGSGIKRPASNSQVVSGGQEHCLSKSRRRDRFRRFRCRSPTQDRGLILVPDPFRVQVLCLDRARVLRVRMTRGVITLSLIIVMPRVTGAFLVFRERGVLTGRLPLIQSLA